jgi:hypothetical protein
MQWQEDIGHLLNFLDRVIGLGQIDVHTGCDGRTRRWEIFVIAAKAGYDRPSV